MLTFLTKCKLETLLKYNCNINVTQEKKSVKVLKYQAKNDATKNEAF